MKCEQYIMLGTRYQFDFGVCHFSKGWAQVDTDQDFPHFGIWINPRDLHVIIFAEGDVTEMTADNKLEFIGYVRRLAKDESWRGIDTLCQDSIEQEFHSLGLSDLFHPDRTST